MAAQSSLENGNTCKAPDGSTIGQLQNDGILVVGPDGNCIGTRKDDGAVIAGHVAGVPAASVLAATSTLTPDKEVKAPDGSVIGKLQGECGIVADDAGKCVGVMYDDGAVIANSIAGLPVVNVVACDSSVKPDQTVVGPDGLAIGTLQPDGITVLGDDDKCVGVMNEDGPVVTSSVTGLPPDNVVASVSTVTDDQKVLGPGDEVVGTLAGEARAEGRERLRCGGARSRLRFTFLDESGRPEREARARDRGAGYQSERLKQTTTGDQKE